MIKGPVKRLWLNDKKSILQYDHLESKNLLAVSVGFDSGDLTVEMDADSDQAVVEIVNDEVLINGNVVDGDVGQIGIQPINPVDIQTMLFSANEGVEDSSVQFVSNFDAGTLNSLQFNNIHDV
ncbi:MAG: hypothetical protein AAGA30_15715, partial [Planctomycetota bacterium]